MARQPTSRHSASRSRRPERIVIEDVEPVVSNEGPDAGTLPALRSEGGEQPVVFGDALAPEAAATGDEPGSQTRPSESEPPPQARRISMVGMTAFKNPFTDFDFSKVVGEFKFPMIDVDSLVDLQRRNMQAFTAANQTAFEAFRAIAQRQADMLKVGLEDLSKASGEMFAAGSLEEKAVKNADLVKKTYETAIANMKELSELYAKGNADAFEAINRRVTEALEEVKGITLKK